MQSLLHCGLVLQVLLFRPLPSHESLIWETVNGYPCTVTRARYISPILCKVYVRLISVIMCIITPACQCTFDENNHLRGPAQGKINLDHNWRNWYAKSQHKDEHYYNFVAPKYNLCQHHLTVYQGLQINNKLQLYTLNLGYGDCRLVFPSEYQLCQIHQL